MSYVILCILLLPTVFLKPKDKFTWNDLPKDCGRTRYGDKKLPINDNEAHMGQFPWMARLGIVNRVTRISFFFCSGAIIHPSFILTAAHCGKEGKIARVGQHDVDTNVDCDNINKCALPPQDIPIKSMVFQDHCRLSNEKDVAVAILKIPMQLNEFVVPICLPRKGVKRADLKNKSLVVSGWGMVYSGFGVLLPEDFRPVRNLKYVDIVGLSEKDCNKAYVRPIASNEYCVKYANVKDPCIADSGSPMTTSMVINGQHRQHIIAVASHDLTLCERKKIRAASYMDVTYFISWIIKTINKKLKET